MLGALQFRSGGGRAGPTGFEQAFSQAGFSVQNFGDEAEFWLGGVAWMACQMLAASWILHKTEKTSRCHLVKFVFANILRKKVSSVNTPSSA